MLNTIGRRIILCYSLFGLLVFTVGCGGGTTGTSSTGELRLAGYAQATSGERLATIPMTVRSGEDQDELLASKTDAEGVFAMSLPGSESSVVVDVNGQRSSPIVRSFNGSSVLSTILTVPSGGTVLAQDSFEVQIDEGSLCQALGIDGNELFVKGAPSQTCQVRVRISSNTYPLSTFSGSLEEICDGSSTVISSVSAAGDGTVTLEVGNAIVRGCDSLKIRVLSSSDPARQIILPIN